MTTTEFYTKRNEEIINRYDELKKSTPKKKRSEILKTISDEYTKKGETLSVNTIKRICFDISYMPQTKKQSA